MSKLRDYLDFVKIEHTLFALPFAYSGAFLASNGWFGFRLFFLILTAFTALRTAAMSLNRIIDREIDALNPRTAGRHIPSGKISVGEGYAIVFVGFAVYVLSAYLINYTAFILSPIPAITAWIYPYLKRFTCFSHFVLGLNLAFAPLGGWVAVRNSMDFLSSGFVPLMIGVSLIFWVAGFDIIYALQDIEFDRKMGLHSIGAHFGVEVAKKVSAASHITFFLILVYVFIFWIPGDFLFYGMLMVGMILFFEHYIVKDRYDEKRVQLAFFYSNALVSSIFLTLIILSTFI